MLTGTGIVPSLPLRCDNDYDVARGRRHLVFGAPGVQPGANFLPCRVTACFADGTGVDFCSGGSVLLGFLTLDQCACWITSSMNPSVPSSVAGQRVAGRDLSTRRQS